MHEDDVRAVLAGTGLQDGVVGLRAEHTPRRTDEEVRAVLEEPRHHLRRPAVGADHHAHAAVRGPEHERLLAGRVPHRLVSQLLLAVSADELPVGADQHRGVVAPLAVRLEHAGHEVDVQLVGEAGELAGVFAVGDGLAQCPVGLQRDVLVGDGVAVEEALRGADDPRAASCRLADHRLDSPVVARLCGAQPFEHDPSHAHRARRRLIRQAARRRDETDDRRHKQRPRTHHLTSRPAPDLTHNTSALAEVNEEKGPGEKVSGTFFCRGRPPGGSIAYLRRRIGGQAAKE